MKYDQPELQMRLAAEYVLGTLRGSARTRFEHLLANDPALRARVSGWEQRLGVWGAVVKPEPVPARVWQQVSIRLGHIPAAPVAKFKWWQWWAWGSTAVAFSLALVMIFHPLTLPAPRFNDLAVLASDAKVPSWIVRVDDGRQTLHLSGIASASVPAGKTLELWSIPGQGAPMSLGLISIQHGHAVLRLTPTQQDRLQQAVALAISLEPAGGSPSGLPTGPVLYSGKLAGS
ncbi:MAG TPA: anti-sigma factor [Pseudomonadales bacterium]|nr:anti-sigma factor [Pseudomonadales bacterium]